MNLTEKEMVNYRKYCTPKGKMYRRVVNDVVFSTGEGKPHAMKKASLCYDLRKQGIKYICEAVIGKERHDIVELATDLKYEIETSLKRSLRFKERKDIIVVKLF